MSDYHHSEFWNEEYRENPANVWVPDRLLAGEVNGLMPTTALDLGCGSGQNSLALAERGWRVLGVDFSDVAIDMARADAAKRGLSADFLVADTASWHPVHSFDLVISTYSLPGGGKNQNILANAAMALALGGTIIIADWDKSMAKVWGFPEDELLSPEEITAQLPGIYIEAAEVREIDAFEKEDPRYVEGARAKAAFVRGRK